MNRRSNETLEFKSNNKALRWLGFLIVASWAAVFGILVWALL